MFTVFDWCVRVNMIHIQKYSQLNVNKNISIIPIHFCA